MTRTKAKWVAQDLLRQEPARIRLLSLHEHVANFVIEDQTHLLMISDPSVYPGPSAIGLSYEAYGELSQTLSSNQTGQMEDGQVKVQRGTGEFTISYGDYVRDFSIPSDLDWKRETVRASTRLATDFIVQSQRSISTSLLLSANRASKKGICDDFHETFFLTAFREHVPALVRAIIQGDKESFWNAVSKLVGLGQGSTPSGDDLIHGALVAYQYARIAQGQPYEVPFMPPELIEQTTMLGRHMLIMGSRGLTPEPIRGFLSSLLRGQVNEVVISKLGDIGASTGWDIATAALLMLIQLEEEGRE